VLKVYYLGGLFQKVLSKTGVHIRFVLPSMLLESSLILE
jgi:hypothetical protein